MVDFGSSVSVLEEVAGFERSVQTLLIAEGEWSALSNAEGGCRQVKRSSSFPDHKKESLARSHGVGVPDRNRQDLRKCAVVMYENAACC